MDVAASLEQVASLGLRATWAVEESALAKAGRSIVSAHGQELALLLQPTADSAADERRVRHLSLALQLASFRRLGQGVTTIVGDGFASADDSEMLVRQGVTAVRTSEGPSERKPTKGWRLFGLGRTKQPSSVRAVRWGLRQLRPEYSLPEAGSRTVRRAIDSVRAGRPCPLVLAIDLAQASSRQVIAVIEHLARLRDVRQLEVMGIADCVAQLDGALRSRPTRSILKSNAA
jgi:hypothetical protein